MAKLALKLRDQKRRQTVEKFKARRAALIEIIEDSRASDEAREEATRVIRELVENDNAEIKLLQEHLHDAIGQLIYDRARRRPLILPVVVEV